MHHRYHFNLFWSDDDACWIAAVPDLAYCSAYSPTPLCALADVKTAVTPWPAVQVGVEQSLPRLGYRPTIYAARRIRGSTELLELEGEGGARISTEYRPRLGQITC